MVHNRKLVLSGVALTMARMPAKQNGTALSRVRDEIEQEIVQSGYLNKAPFSWVGLIIRFGLNNQTEPSYNGINKKHGDLPLSIEIDVHRLLNATEEEMVKVYRKATLISLVHAGQKYGLEITRLNDLLIQAVR